MKLHTGVTHDGVEADSVLALDALLELRVDVEGHLGVGVPDLAHDPLDVEAIGQQSDRDVRPPQTVRRRPWKRGNAVGAALLGREGRSLADDLGDALAAGPAAAHVLHHVVVGLRAVASSAESVEMVDAGPRRRRAATRPAVVAYRGGQSLSPLSSRRAVDAQRVLPRTIQRFTPVQATSRFLTMVGLSS